jgi:hypothetical protein
MFDPEASIVVHGNDTPEALLAKLWEMVNCDNCEYQVDETVALGGCATANKVLFCAHWEPLASQ